MRKTIKEFDIFDRPREKLIREGSEALSDEELLAIIISTGTKDKNAIDLSKEILDTFTSEELAEIEVDELTKISGIKEAKASMIVASLKFGKRISQKMLDRTIVKIESSEDIFLLLKDTLSQKKKEYFYAILLDTKNVIISKEIISIGDLNSSIVNPREVFKPAVKKSAKSVILAHNHPSGQINPSREDFLITDRLIQAGNILDIKVLDHIIIGMDGYYSFKKENNI